MKLNVGYKRTTSSRSHDFNVIIITLPTALSAFILKEKSVIMNTTRL